MVTLDASQDLVERRISGDIKKEAATGKSFRVADRLI
jgi:hypothetical protein